MGETRRVLPEWARFALSLITGVGTLRFAHPPAAPRQQ